MNMEASFDAQVARVPKYVNYKDSQGNLHTFDAKAVDRIYPLYKDLGVDWSTISFKPDEKGVVQDEIIIADNPETVVDALNGKPSFRAMQSNLSQMINAVASGRLEYIEDLESSYVLRKQALDHATVDYSGQKNISKKKEAALGWWTKRLLAAYEREVPGEIDEFVTEATNLIAPQKFKVIDEVLTARKKLSELADEHIKAAQDFADIIPETQLLGGISVFKKIKTELEDELMMSERERKSVIEGLFNHLSEGYRRKIEKSPYQVLFSKVHGDNSGSYRLTADIEQEDAQRIKRENAENNIPALPVLTLDRQALVMSGPNGKKGIIKGPSDSFEVQPSREEIRPAPAKRASGTLTPRPSVS